jgi:hypothetical protein
LRACPSRSRKRTPRGSRAPRSRGAWRSRERVDERQ